MSEDATAASDRPAHLLDRVRGAIAGLEPAVLEKAISFLQSREALRKASEAVGEASSPERAESEVLAPLPWNAALRALRLTVRFARHGYDQTQAEAARDVDRYEAYARMAPEERKHLAEALSGSLAGPVLDLLVLEALGTDEPLQEEEPGGPFLLNNTPDPERAGPGGDEANQG